MAVKDKWIFKVQLPRLLLCTHFQIMRPYAPLGDIRNDDDFQIMSKQPGAIWVFVVVKKTLQEFPQIKFKL